MKQKRYWLRGGVIAVFISSLLFFIVIVPSLDQMLAPLSENNAGSFLFRPFLFSLLYLLSLAIRAIFFSIFLESNFEYNICRILNCGDHRTYFDFLIIIIIYFIVGAFIGWLYGKVKNRNKVK